MNKDRFEIINIVYEYVKDNYPSNEISINYKEDKEIECKLHGTKKIFKLTVTNKKILLTKQLSKKNIRFYNIKSKTNEEILELIDHLIENTKKYTMKRNEEKLNFGINYPIHINTNSETFFNNLEECIQEDIEYSNKELTNLNKTVLIKSGAEGKLLAKFNTIENIKDIKTQVVIKDEEENIINAPIVILLNDNSIIMVIATYDTESMLTSKYLDQYVALEKYCEKNGYCYGMIDRRYTPFRDIIDYDLDENDEEYKQIENELMNDIIKGKFYKRDLKKYYQKYTNKVINKIIYKNSSKLSLGYCLSSIQYKKED